MEVFKVTFYYLLSQHLKEVHAPIAEDFLVQLDVVVFNDDVVKGWYGCSCCQFKNVPNTDLKRSFMFPFAP